MAAVEAGPAPAGVAEAGPGPAAAGTVAAGSVAATITALADRAGWEERGQLSGAYHDLARGTLVTYRAVRLWLGWSVSFVAGLLSGLLGVGGGFLKVPAMNLGMRVPIKVAAGTSNFMVGVTAVASLFVYFTRGYVLPSPPPRSRSGSRSGPTWAPRAPSGSRG